MPQDDPSFEREKWLADLELRRRELNLKERDQQGATWHSPLIVAILAAAVAAGGNAVVAVINGSLQRDVEAEKARAELSLERSKAESTRILEMIRTGDAEHAAANLEFLLRSGLISDPALSEKVQHFLNTRKPGRGPALPSPSGRIGFEQSELLTEPVQRTLENTLARYFDFLDRIGFAKPAVIPTVSLSQTEGLNAYYSNNKIVIHPSMVDEPFVALREYTHHVLVGATKIESTDVAVMAVESGAADYFAASFLDTPNVGEKLVRLYGLNRPFLRTLANQQTYAEMATKDAPAARGELWGGLLWDIRKKLGAPAADALAASAWLSFWRPGAPHDDKAFMAALFGAAKTRGQPALAALRSAADARKIPHG
jgi:hypothetical protein